jgi:hypothetical protein
MQLPFRRLEERQPTLWLDDAPCAASDNLRGAIMQNITTIEKLLKDELSATETYQKALEELNFPGGHFASNSLKPMFGDHQEAVSMLQAHIVKLGGTPNKIAGYWGTWPKIIFEGANLLGKGPAIRVLLAGEKAGEAGYVEALKNSTLSSDIRTLIEKKLLPSQQSHIRSLDRVLKALPA